MIELGNEDAVGLVTGEGADSFFFPKRLRRTPELLRGVATLGESACARFFPSSPLLALPSVVNGLATKFSSMLARPAEKIFEGDALEEGSNLDSLARSMVVCGGVER